MSGRTIAGFVACCCVLSVTLVLLFHHCYGLDKLTRSKAQFSVSYTPADTVPSRSGWISDSLQWQLDHPRTVNQYCQGWCTTGKRDTTSVDMLVTAKVFMKGGDDRWYQGAGVISGWVIRELFIENNADRYYMNGWKPTEWRAVGYLYSDRKTPVKGRVWMTQ